MKPIEREDDFSRLELNLPNCLENYRYFRSILNPGTRLLVLVKANAYGHGAVEFARMMEDAGADYLAVAYPVEGTELRNAGIKSPVLVLTAGTDFFDEIIDNNLEPGIPNMYTLKALCETLRKRGIENFPIHIKLDTGMHRLGFMTGELDELTSFIPSCKNVSVKSVYSHLAASEDPQSDDFTLGQISLFRENADRITAAIGYRPLYHILNSAGIERFPQYQFDMVRLGIGIYGVSALPGVKLAPVASFKCKILQIKHLKPEDGTIGYGRYGKIASGGTRIATIPVGYADGIDRHLGRGRCSFLLNGCRVPTIGNICMDMCMLDITGVKASVGDTVTIFGEEPTVSELASVLDTIPYEILTSVPRRIERVVVSSKFRLLFVCLGNICRSPAAQGIFQTMADRNAMQDRFVVDSAGTYSGHRGELPDRRMRNAAAARGYELSHRSRPLSLSDFLDYDLIIAMDDDNYEDLMRLAPSVETSRKIKRMADFLSASSMTYVPDPYYMGADGFELVLDLLEDGCRNLYDRIVSGTVCKDL